MASFSYRGKSSINISHRGGGGTLEATANGTYTADGAAYKTVIVDVPGGGVATEELEITENGEYVAPAGKAYRKIIVNVPQGSILKPGISVKLNCASCYDPYDTELESIVVSMTVTKGTNPLKDMKLYVGSTLLQTYENIAAGTVSFTYTPDTPIKSTLTFKAVVSDKSNNTSTGQATVTFVGKTFYGILSSDISVPTEAQIKSLNTVQKATKGYTWSDINTDYGKVTYCIPTSMGAISSIKDTNNFQYIDSMTVKSVAVNGVLYYVYIQTVASAAEHVTLAFA